MESLRREKEPEASGIDLTPMLDVVFIMRIFFIVTASFIHEATLQIDRPPKGKTTSITEQINLIVELQADNQIVDNRLVDHRSLRAYVERHLASHPEAAMVINASNTSKTFAVARVVDAAREAGLFRIVLANRE